MEKIDYSILKEEVECETFHLSESISDDIYKDWWSNEYINVLDKTECGNGGTTGFINYALKNNKSCVICVPNVSICISKEKEYGSDCRFCAAYGDKKIEKEAQVIICTYDKYYTDIESVKSGMCMNIDGEYHFWENRLIVFDEFHKFVSDSDFRKICYTSTRRILNSKHCVLMSATPDDKYIQMLKWLGEGHKRIKITKVKYTENVHSPFKGNVHIFNTKKYGINGVRDAIVGTYLRRVNEDALKENNLDYSAQPYKFKHIVVMWSNLKEINDMISKLKIDDVEVLCSHQHKDEFGMLYSENISKDKRIHFLTSAYFTGFDIDINIDRCFIIGSPHVASTCYSKTDIQQMLGRFRGGVNSIVIFYMKKNKDVVEHVNLYNNKKNNEDFIKVWKDEEGGKCDRWTDSRIIELLTKHIRYSEKTESIDIWCNAKLLEKTISEISRYNCVLETTQDTDEYFKHCKNAYKKIRTLTFRDAKKRLLDGSPVSLFEYNKVYILKRFKEIYGDSAFRNASLRDMQCKVEFINKVDNWYQNNDDITDVIKSNYQYIRECNIDDRRDIFALKAGYNRLSVIKTILEELECRNVHSWEVNSLMVEYFNFICLMFNSGMRDFNRRVLLIDCYDLKHAFLQDLLGGTVDINSTTTAKVEKKHEFNNQLSTIGYEEQISLVSTEGDSGIKSLDDINLTINSKRGHPNSNDPYCLVRTLGEIQNYKVNHNCYVKNIRNSLDHIINIDERQKYISLYDYIMGDKSNRIPEVKNNTELNDLWGKIKKYHQSKLSELHYQLKKDKPFDEKRMKKDFLYLVNSFILDIDNGMKFSEFKEHYKDIEWYAYPSLNNTDDDWVKFRVIFPNTTTLIIKGEYNLKILKVLRLNICSLEDENHGLYSFINDEDMKKIVYHSGKRIDYNQDMVDNLQNFFKSLDTYYAESSETDSDDTSKSYWTLDKAKEFVKSKDGIPNKFHTSFFTAKTNMNPQDYKEFDEWVAETFGKRGIDHNISHRKFYK